MYASLMNLLGGCLIFMMVYYFFEPVDYFLVTVYDFCMMVNDF